MLNLELRRTQAEQYLEPNVHVGEFIELGALIGFGQEQYQLWGRLVAIFKDDRKPINTFVIRIFRPEDTTFPTGEYKTTSHMFLIPWMKHG